MKKILLYLLFTLLLVGKSFDSKEIAIDFQGNKHVSRSSLEAVVGALRPSFIALWKKDVALIDRMLVDKLDDTFTVFYKNEGFYDANISHTLDAIGVHFFIQENQFVKIEKIIIESDFDIDEAITLREKKRFRAEEFGQTKKNIKTRMMSKGYCSYDLNTKAYLDLEKHRANIVIKLKKGGLCHFGAVTVKGVSTIDDDVILSRLYFKEGDLFNVDKIKESYQSLYALEAFDQVYMKHDLKFYNVIPVDIDFIEVQQKIHSRMGVGYATDLKFQAKYHWEYKNFRGNGKKLLFDLLFSSKQRAIENSFLYPHITSLNDYYLDFENSVGYTEEKEIHDYNEKVLYNKSYLSHKDDQWYNSIGLGVENREIDNRETFFLIYPFMKLVYDLRDSKINPTQGVYFSHEMEYGLPYSSDSTSYLKYLEELRLIYSLADVTFSAVGRMGSIQVYKNKMPESKKFFAGGAFSNRAYGYDKIGITESAVRDSPEGGYTLANLSFESNFPIYNSFRGALFSDNTMISKNQGIWEFSNKVIYSAGIGFRYLTPIGPFKIDMGLNVRNQQERAVHFQVGQSF